MVPEFPPPPPPLFPPRPPQPITPKETTSTNTPSIVTQLRLFRGIPNSNRASAVPAEGHSRFFNSLFALLGAVVMIVSVELCAPVPLIVTELGVKVQVGELLASAGVIVQVRLTIPVKPFDGVTVIATVFPVVAPGSILSDELLPPTTNVGSAFTVSAMVVDAVSKPEVPVIVTVTGPPTVAVPAAVSVSTLDPVAGFVPNDAVTPLGKALAESVTLPENPFAPEIVTVSVLLLPSTTLSAPAEAERVKLGAAFTVTKLVPEALL